MEEVEEEELLQALLITPGQSSSWAWQLHSFSVVFVLVRLACQSCQQCGNAQILNENK